MTFLSLSYNQFLQLLLPTPYSLLPTPYSLLPTPSPNLKFP
ncbi:hypothetical protein [Moorena sp. SIO1F2]|nr:hypothetical protein [Moorena sp. SIO1F2]